MATPEAVANRRANRKAAREAKRISRKLREINQNELGAELLRADHAKRVEAQRASHNRAWFRFQKRALSIPRFAPMASDQRYWEAWVAMIDRRNAARIEWFIGLDDDTRFILCTEGRTSRADARKYKRAALTARSRQYAIDKGLNYQLL